MKLLGTGSSLPRTQVSDDDLSKFLDTNDEWIYTRTGIRERRVSVDKPNFYMAEQAALAHVKNAQARMQDMED